jgi:hypothetical protein
MFPGLLNALQSTPQSTPVVRLCGTDSERYGKPSTAWKHLPGHTLRRHGILVEAALH